MSASTEGLVPITRAYLASYYDKYIFPPLSDDVVRLTAEIRSLSGDLLNDSGSPPNQEEKLLREEAECEAPHKIDENMWKNREQIEEIMFLLDSSTWQSLQSPSMPQVSSRVSRLKDKLASTFKVLEYFQTKNSEFVFNTVMTYMPQDFRGTLIRQQRERSERNKQAQVEALINSGGSIRDRYTMLWGQQMERLSFYRQISPFFFFLLDNTGFIVLGLVLVCRRRQLAQLGSATGVYKTLVKYLVGVPQVLLDFIRQINDDQGPMEEQRQRYGPPLYSLTTMVLNIRLFTYLLWKRLEAQKVQESHLSSLEAAVAVYTSEFERFIKFIGEVFANSPFFIKAEDAGALEARKNDDLKETNVPAGKNFEVALTVDSVNSYIAWDFSLVQGRMNMQDIGFSIEYTDESGQKTMILPYRRYESDQGNFCTMMAGNYRLIWDNTYSAFFKKVLRYKVDCIPPVVEPISAANEMEE
ncbi:OLC1v1033484C1 [Oldenlandia corymbosa var. corymbosa]|uniref:OLC1v1033484C1 n=1 Tax=Oldenlandia corymbosa var. corymbosa TaxID=529605 RepID=A0AAV1CRA8_OLDCO|nr:OLC1v1033484C1 [Oldenlandia corymbosa var. corymbosa]